jgi:hypothetical protein
LALAFALPLAASVTPLLPRESRAQTAPAAPEAADAGREPAANGEARPPEPAPAASPPTPGDAGAPPPRVVTSYAPSAAAGRGASDGVTLRQLSRGKAVKGATGLPVAAFPAFSMGPEGGSMVTVQLSRAVRVEERRARGSITYVLRGTRVPRRNDTNALVTVHFNTPVERVRLLPRGADAHLVLDLRADVAPAHVLVPATSAGSGDDRAAGGARDASPRDGAHDGRADGGPGGVTLRIDFPKGDYLPKGGARGAGAAPDGEGAGSDADR